MQVKRQNINIGRVIYEGDIKTTAEGSIIVPDVKPDILKILQVDAETFLCEKYIDDGKITLKGKVNVNILYVPEGDGCCVQCIKGCFEFCETLKRSEFTPDMRLIACCDAEKVGYKLINSRKVGINSQITISLQVIGNRKCCFISDVEEESAQMQYDNVNLCSMNDYREFNFNIEETLDFPTGKCAVAEILKSNVMIFDKEYKALAGKLVIKGRVNACILYLDENSRCEHAEFELPFTEVFDMDELTEDTGCDITYEIGDTNFKLIPDSNGDIKRTVMSVDVMVGVKTEIQENMPALHDCYFTDADCSLSYDDVETENVVERPMFSAMMKELLQKDSNAPEIESVYSAVAKPYVTATQVQNGRLAVSGKTVVYILYTTQNPQIPVCSINEEIPFSYMIDCEHASRDSEVMLSCECEHISYTLSSSNAVEVRCGLCISGKVVKKSSVRVITEVETAQLKKTDSGVIIYFVKSGDSIWDIAKRYHVRGENILSCNNLEDGASIKQGDKLIIPVR